MSQDPYDPKQKKTVMDMELRDFFAAMAMNGIASGEDIRGHETEVAEVSYRMADEMIKRRRANKEAVRGRVLPAGDAQPDHNNGAWAPARR